MVDDKSTLQSIGEHIIVALQPLSDSFSDFTKFKEFMFRLGWNVNSMPSSYANLAQLINEAQITLNSLPENPDIDQIDDLLLKIKEIYSAIRSVAEAPDGVDSQAFLSEIGERIFEILLVDYLRSEFPIYYNGLQMLGIIDQQYFEATNARPSFLRTRFRFDQIQRLVFDPLSILEIVYGWGTEQLKFPLIASHLHELLQSLNFLTSIRRVDRRLQYGYQPPSDRFSRPINLMLKIPIFSMTIGENPVEVTLSLLELPPKEGKLPGIIVQPHIPSEVGREFVIDDNMTIKIRDGTDLSSLFGFLIRPGEVSFRNPFQPDLKLPDAGFGITLEYLNENPIVIFGSQHRSCLQMKGIAISLNANYNQEQSELVFVVEIVLKDLTLIIAGAEQDSFLAKLFGDRNLIIPIPIVIQWSSKTGLHFIGSSGFSVTSNPHLKIGGVKIDKLTLRLLSGDSVDPQPNFATEILVALSGSMGPVSFSIDDIGLQLKTVLKDGNAGPFQIGVDVVPPSGMGLVINANGVKGGGFISRKENQYSGVIDLDLRSYSIQAFALLDTRDTSFLFALFSQFRTPIQLGAGWKITKIGGLIGINRTVSLNDLASGIRSGILDSIMFPDNVIENAPRIISDLKRVFPSKSGQHLIGPVIRIAYGTPTLITGDIALILEFPSPFQLSLIGRVRAMLPDEKHPLVQINLAVLGAIDFTNERLGVYGTLYDSKILDFTLSGDMAMAASWGEEKNFVFSIGGFNPRFDPPSNFPPFNAPPLRRLNVALSSHISLGCYLALTSNTLQFGARIDALFKRGSEITIKGFLGFDALVQFDPLYYIVDVAAGLSVKFKGASLCLTFSGFIEGPNPHRIKGSVTISILWWDISVDVDETFGEQKPELINNIDPWPVLKEALEQNDSWTVEHPTWEVTGVVTKESSSGVQQQLEGSQLVHPLGSLKVSQKVVPLNHTLTKFGSSDPKDHFRFEISKVSLNNTDPPRLETTQDFFAPAQFTEYDNSEKLNLKSYDLMDSGVFFASSEEEVAFIEKFVSHKEILYETKILENIANKGDIRRTSTKKLFQLDTMLAQTFVLASSVYHNSLSSNNKLKYQLKHRTRESLLDNEKFVIVDEDEKMAQVPVLKGELSQSTAINKLRDYMRANPQDKQNFKVISSFEKLEVAP